MSLKELLGEVYREDITLQEIEEVLKDKKLVDLSKGEYVAKKKYDDLAAKVSEKDAKISELESKAPETITPENYENDMQELASLREEKKTNEFRNKIKSLGVSDKFIDYVAKSVANDETFETAFEQFKVNNDFIFEKNLKPYSQQDLNIDNGEKVTTFADAVQEHYNNNNK
jgi:hypothetical protein